VNHSIILEALKECNVPEPISKWIMNAISHSECYNLSLEEWKEDLRNKGLDDHSLNKISSIEEAKAINKSMAKGVPQGLSISPVLSCLAKSYILKDYGSKMVCYVDDGIIYSEEEINLESFKKAMTILGTEINEEKSSWLKKDGSWMKNKFKFLGIEYNVENDTMKAASRSGRSQKLFPKADWENCQNLDFLNFAKTHGEISASINWNLFDSLLNWTWSPDDLTLESTNFDLIICKFNHCFLNDYSNLIKLIGPKTSVSIFNLASRCSQALYFTYKTSSWSQQTLNKILA
jgi:hypothetical protein